MTEHISKYKINFIILVFAFAISIRLLFVWYNFHGIEYEDAYIFADTARSLMFDYDWSTDIFQTKSCMDGSLKECYMTKTYGGHYMVFPFVLYLLNKLIGFSVLNVFIINFIASVLVLYVFYKLLKSLKKNNNEIIVAMVMFTSTPFINVFNTSGLSETFSSLLVLSFVYFFFKICIEISECDFKYYVLAITFVILSFLTKRENLILLILPVLKIVVDLYYKDISYRNAFRLSSITIIPSVFALIYNMFSKVNEMEMAESKELGVSTFSFDIFKELFPVYLKSYFNFNLYGISGIIVIIFCIYAIFKKNNDELKITSILSVLYLVMYSSHYRSYYQIHYGDVEVFDTLRYSSNFYPIACLALSNFYGLILNYSHRINKITIRLVIVFFMLFVIYSNFKLRINLSEIEHAKIILPITQTLEITSENDIVLTDMTSVFHLYADVNRIFLDSHNVSFERINSIADSGNFKIYFLNKIDNDKNIVRYDNFKKIIDNFTFKRVAKINNDYELILLLKSDRSGR